MPRSALASRHLLRWIAIAVAVVLAALAAGVGLYVHSLLQPERFTSLLARDLAAMGLELNMQAPAAPALFPRPGVQLPAFSLSNSGSGVPVLRANGATIVVPWRALWRGQAAIERISIDSPRIDLGELQGTLARLPAHAGPPRLPTITTGVHMHHGMLTQGGSPVLFGFSLDTGALVAGQTFRLDAAGRTAGGRRLTANLTTVPAAPDDGAIAFSDIRFRLAEQAGAVLELAGNANWRGGKDLGMRLAGTLVHGALAPVPASADSVPAAAAASAAVPASAATVRDAIRVAVDPPAADAPLQVAFKLDGPDAQVDMQLQPTEFGAWWQRALAATPDRPPGPLPFTGSARAERIDLGGLKATGLSIEAGPDLAPASSAGAPASPASAAPAPR